MNKAFLSFLIVITITSCVSKRNTIYVQNKIGSSDNIITNRKIPYKISSNDLLRIKIQSSNPKITELFSTNAEEGGVYALNDSGYIFMPLLDSIQVGGKTLVEIQSLLGKLIKEHITDAIVLVKLAKFNITVLGEVGNQGMVSSQTEELTIFEAIGMAGGINDYGNKRKVELIRKEGNSTKFIEMDLTDRRIVSSEYFYIQPNDVIYVEPLRAKNIRTNVGQISLFIGIATFLLILNNYLKIIK